MGVLQPSDVREAFARRVWERVLDTEIEIRDTQWSRVPFTLDARLWVRLTVRSIEGNRFTIRVVDAPQWNALRAGGEFEHYPAYAQTKVTHAEAPITALPAGGYVIALREASAPNLSGAADVARVHVLLETRR